MTLSIGKTIRKLRKERNLTQEELAELINVTAQAVSKWENELGMPDISQILPLASVFGVSTDVLFGIAGMNDKEEVEKLIHELHEKNKCLEINDREEYQALLEAVDRYPNHYSLLYSCLIKGIFLLCTEWREQLTEEERKEVYDTCMRHSRVILSYCQDTTILMNTRRELIYLYSRMGEKQKAAELISELPNSILDTSGIIMARFLYGQHNWKETIPACQKNLYDMLGEFSHQSELLASAYMRTGDYPKAQRVCESMLDVIRAIYRDETYTPPIHYHQIFYRLLAICALRSGDTDKAVAYLEDMFAYTMHQHTGFNKIKNVKTPMLDRYKMEFNYPNYQPKQMLLSQVTKECFSPLRENERYLRLMEKIELLPE